MHAVPARSSIGSVPCFGGDVSGMSVEHQLFVGKYEQEDEHLLPTAPSSPMCMLDVESLDRSTSSFEYRMLMLGSADYHRLVHCVMPHYKVEEGCI